MPYEAPSYVELCLRSETLDETFNEVSHRYSPPSYAILRERVSQLEPNYRQKVGAKSHFFFGSSVDSQRLKEIESITALMRSLLSKAVSGVADESQLSAILLGSLFYRRLVIKASYAQSASAGFGSEMDSALYQSIHELLGITDSNKLDFLTVASGLRAYYFYVQKNPHFRCSEPKFSATLSDLISRCELASQPMVNQIKYLSGITSIATSLKITDTQTREGFSVLSKVLVIELKQKASLSRDQLKVYVERLPLSNRVKASVIYMIPDDIALTLVNHAMFEARMKARLERNSQYVLLGAYLLVLSLCEGDDAALKKTLKQVIGISIENRMDDKTKELALTALDSYLALPDMKRDFEFLSWQSYDMLQFLVACQLEEAEKINQVVMW